ncbi:hypothetical protein CMV_002727 [Castanea mollissima]|uniref:Uncharacterized protein n=1 Tax=Castanea mollissima TaxID=60419 RepID=A0A8J4RUC1_9ROSI|nr:hypothetical protein CMV_002727 [Castanea mollissima]
MLSRFTKNEFDDNIVIVKAQIWDTAGQERLTDRKFSLSSLSRFISPLVHRSHSPLIRSQQVNHDARDPEMTPWQSS